jgi:digeranylgeranylglycerophospholipid reductase
LSNISVDPHTIEIWFLPEFESLDGYAWVFPKSSTIANVGCGITSAITKKLGMNIEDVLSKFIKKRFYDQDPKPILRMNGVDPVGTCNQLVSPGIALVGDAGRMVTPISGGGIENAIKAGILLGDVVSTTGTSFVSLKRYEMEYMIKRGLKMNTIYKLRKMLSFIFSKVSPNILWMGADAMKLLFDFRGVLIDITE